MNLLKQLPVEIRIIVIGLLALSAASGSMAGWALKSVTGAAQIDLAKDQLEARLTKVENQVMTMSREVTEIKRLLIDMNCQDLGLTQPQCLAEHLRREAK